MKILNFFVEKEDYKKKSEVLQKDISDAVEALLAAEKKIRDLKFENKKLRSENYTLKCRVHKKKRENRKPIIDKACKMAKELAVEIPLMGDVK